MVLRYARERASFPAIESVYDVWMFADEFSAGDRDGGVVEEGEAVDVQAELDWEGEHVAGVCC